MSNVRNRLAGILTQDGFVFNLFLAVYFSVLIYLAWSLTIWEDESYSLITSSNDLGKVITQSYEFEGQPPFYFVLLSLWRKLDNSIFFARMLSVGLMAITFFSFDKIIRAIVGHSVSKWPLVIFMLSPFTVWAALEIRLYALIICVTCLAVHYFFRYLKEGKGKDLLVLLILFEIGLYTQYFFSFMIVIFCLITLVIKGWTEFFKFLFSLIPVGIFFLPNVYFFSHQIDMHGRNILLETYVDKLKDILFGGGHLSPGLQMTDIQFAVRILLVVSLIFIFAWSVINVLLPKFEHNRRIIRALNIIIFSVLLLAGMFAIAFGYLNIQFKLKYMSCVYIPVMTGLILVESIGTRVRIIVSSVVSLFLFIQLFEYYSSNMKSYNYPAIVSYLEKTERKGEPWVFYTKLLVAPFSFYVDEKRKLDGLPASVYNGEYYNNNILDTTDLGRNISRLSTKSSSYLLVTDSLWDFKNPTKIVYKDVDAYLNENYIISLDTSIRGRTEKDYLRIRRLEIRK